MRVAICTSDSRLSMIKLFNRDSNNICNGNNRNTQGGIFSNCLGGKGCQDSIYCIFRDLHVEIFSCRESTLEFVERVGISSLVDMIVCGDDQVVVVQHLHYVITTTKYISLT